MSADVFLSISDVGEHCDHALNYIWVNESKDNILVQMSDRRLWSNNFWFDEIYSKHTNRY